MSIESAETSATGLPRLGDLPWRSLTLIIFHLATPVVLAQLSQVLMGLIDTLMVGQLGAESLAAVGLATLLFSALAMSIKAVDVACQTYTARRVGACRDGEVGAVLATALTATLSVGAVCMAIGMLRPEALIGLVTRDPAVRDLGAGYLFYRYAGILPLLVYFQIKGMCDGIGWTRVGMTVGIGMNVVNAALNWILIFGKLGAPAMGVRGAAVASTISAVLAAGVIAGFVLRPHIRQRFRLLAHGNLQPRLLGPFLALAWPPALQTFSAMLAMMIFFSILGRISTLAVAVGNVVMRIASLSFMPGFGVGAAVQTLVSQSLGRADRHGARRASWGGVGLSVVFMGLFGIVFLLTPAGMLRIFTTSDELVRLGTPIMRLMGLVQVIDAVGLTLAGALRGAGMMRAVMLVDVGTGLGLVPPLAWLFGVRLDGGLFGAWLALLAWFTLFAVGMAILFMRGVWEEVDL